MVWVSCCLWLIVCLFGLLFDVLVFMLTQKCLRLFCMFTVIWCYCCVVYLFVIGGCQFWAVDVELMVEMVDVLRFCWVFAWRKDLVY